MVQSEAWGWGTHLHGPGSDGVPGSGKSANLANLANISGAGRGGIFSSGLERPEPAAVDYAFLGHRDALGLARRVEGILADAAGGFRAQLAGGAGSGGEGLTQPSECGSDGGSGFVAVHHRLRLDMEELGGPGASRG
jgi:hypothetical protein